MREEYVQLPFSPSLVARDELLGLPSSDLMPSFVIRDGRAKRMRYYGEDRRPTSELYRRAALFAARYPQLLNIMPMVWDDALQRVTDWLVCVDSWRQVNRKWKGEVVLDTVEAGLPAHIKMVMGVVKGRWAKTLVTVVDEIKMQDDLLRMVHATMLADLYSRRAAHVLDGKYDYNRTTGATPFWNERTGLRDRTPFISGREVCATAEQWVAAGDNPAASVLTTMYSLERYMDFQAHAFPCLTFMPYASYDWTTYWDEVVVSRPEIMRPKTFDKSDFDTIVQLVLESRTRINRPRPSFLPRYSKKYAPITKAEFSRFASDTVALAFHLVLMGVLLHREHRIKLPGNTDVTETLDGKGDVPWAAMDVVKVPLTNLATQHSRAGRTPGAFEHGSIPRHIHRWPVDQAIFDAPRSHRPGGTVLIDASGSMAWTEEDIAELAASCPNATVAIYSGNGGTGRLAVLADKGRCAAKETMDYEFGWGGGNECDGLALDWMVRQRRPFIWVCDGGVTVSGDSLDGRASRYCQEMIEQHGIFMVPDIEAAKALLSGRDATGVAKSHVNGFYAGGGEISADESFRVISELKGLASHVLRMGGGDDHGK